MITQEQIAKRAYEIWQKRGGQDGNAESDWLQAEAELQKEQQPSALVAPEPSKLSEAVSQALGKRRIAPAKPTKSARRRMTGLKTA